MNTLLKDLMLHRPMKLTNDESLEKRLKSEVNHDFVPLPFQNGEHIGRGKTEVIHNGLRISINNRYDSWMPGDPEDGDYVQYGRGSYRIHIDNQDWTRFNRLWLEVSYEAEGYVNPHIIVSFENNGEVKVPDIYNREGYHGINLDENIKEYIIDISDLPRDTITALSINVMAGGEDRAALENQVYEVTNLKLSQSDNISKSKGWDPKRPIIYSHNGYKEKHPKIAVTQFDCGETFEIIDEVEKVCLTGVVTQNSYGHAIIDFSNITTQGLFKIKCCGFETEFFPIGDYYSRWQDSLYKSINFIYCQRCGTNVRGVHCSCHEDVVAKYKDTLISFNGGWHDAGDLSQQLIQSVELTLSLVELAEAIQDEDELFYERLIEEIEWGIDFILKTRFDNGNRATSAGVSRWSNGRINDFDDSFARVHDAAYENFLIAHAESELAQRLPKGNRLIPKLRKIAQEDYMFANTKFKQVGYDTTPIFWEHTYSTSESLFDATIASAAASLYVLTNETRYLDDAVEFFEHMLMAQHTDNSIVYGSQTIHGFFYRDQKKKSLNHFNHQAREHYYARAFVDILKIASHHDEASTWKKRALMYADYLQFIGLDTNSYGMVASGVYHRDEPLDKEDFEKQHLLTGSEIYSDYQKQLDGGMKIDEKWVLKCFPVWFSFRGNTAILLSTAKAASTLSSCVNRDKLEYIADKQLQWVVGMNPFGQSLMYGVGNNYAQQYTVQSGEMIGEIPVGVQTFENEDEPYWSQFNNATYKEVWTGLAGKWISVISDLLVYSKGEKNE